MKPDNVFIMDDGSVKLGDFGIAKVLAATTEKSEKSKSLQTAGTLCYMPPESFLGE
jgi:serine/threonine protein kinase